MSRIFLSHSSQDNAEAKVLADWLSAKGWDDVFLDLDPHRGMPRANAGYERSIKRRNGAKRCCFSSPKRGLHLAGA